MRANQFNEYHDRAQNFIHQDHVYFIPISLSQYVISRPFPKDSKVRLVRRVESKSTTQCKVWNDLM